jgi:hypothetical protein
MNNEMISYDNEYKKSVIAIMKAITDDGILEECKHIIDPLEYAKLVNRFIINNLSHKDIQRNGRVCDVVRRHLVALFSTKVQVRRNRLSASMDTDVLYNVEDPHLYNNIALNCSIVSEYTMTSGWKDIELTPTIVLSYNSIKSGIPTKPIKIDTCYSHSFYGIYNGAKENLVKCINSDHDIKNNIAKLTNIEKLLEEMAMLVTLFYMKVIIHRNNYDEFMGIDDECDDTTCVDKNIEVGDALISLYRLKEHGDKALASKVIREIQDAVIKICKENNVTLK